MHGYQCGITSARQSWHGTGTGCNSICTWRGRQCGEEVESYDGAIGVVGRLLRLLVAATHHPG